MAVGHASIRLAKNRWDMQIRQVDIRHFRGFSSLHIKPSGHVLVVGEPRAGRSDLVEALTRVFDPDSTRATLTDDLDFFNRDTGTRAEVEIVLGDLGDELEQRFFDQIELWDASSQTLLPPAAPGEEAPSDCERVVRLCYRAEWQEDEQLADHWVDFPKFSDPDTGDYRRVRRIDLAALPFQRVDSSGTPLRLTSRSPFRRIVSMSEGDDFPQALDRMIEELRAGSGEFTASAQVKTALQAVFRDVAGPLGVGDTAPDDIVKFVPDGGSLPSLLRSFSPTVDLGDGAGQLPLQRHGSTSGALIAAGEALAAMHNGASVIVVDDFGEGIDAASAKFAAQALRAAASQAWVSTRRSSVAEAFRTSEIVRLTRSASAQRSVFQGTEPSTRAERLAARHLALQLLPAVAARALVIVEGPHDHAAYQTLATRLFEDEGVPPPGAHGVHLIHAGAADSAGGSSAIPRLANAARALGLRVVNVIDHDGDTPQAAAELQMNLDSADAVVRLPPRVAVERALVSGLDTATLRGALIDLKRAFDLQIDIDSAADADLPDLAVKALKSSGGLHAEFVGALPSGCIPGIARRVIETSLECALGAKEGHQQL